MIHRWSESIAGRLASAGIIQDKKAVYAYGLELLFSSLFSTGAIILISMLARRPFHWLFFSAGFIPLRLTAGGYHASSHMKCVLTTAAAFSVSLFGANVIGNRLSICLLMMLPVFLVVLAFAPVESANKPIPTIKKARNRRWAVIIVCINALIALVLIAFPQTSKGDATAMFFCGVSIAGASILMSKLQKKWR